MTTSRLVPAHLRDFPNIAEHNFLINALIVEFLTETAAKHARGTLLDVGCGTKPYQRLFAPHVDRHVGIDLATSPQGTAAIDVFGTAYATTLPDASGDTLLCTEVLEHLEEPGRALEEFRRVLRPGGHLILTVPFFWQVHEAPRDFYRYSEFGLRHLLETHGFTTLEIKPLSGFIVTFTQLSIYYLRARSRLLKKGLRLPAWALQTLALKLNGLDRSTGFTNVYGAIARSKS
jgi:ubiquinone/menaquinone biosynthesis C-methylase UbiE